jgi:thymidine phosphorylase
MATAPERVVAIVAAAIGPGIDPHQATRALGRLRWHDPFPGEREREMTNGSPNRLRLVRAGIDTYQQAVVFMHRDCAVCRSEGFTALTRVRVRHGEREIIATLNVVTGDQFGRDEAALSESAWAALAPDPDAWGEFDHAEPAGSAAALRAKVFGGRLEESDFLALMRDTVDNRLSDLELAAFVTACAGERLDLAETLALTRAMVAVGQRLDWGGGLVLDKHCVGGLPGNRTTPILVAIVVAAGFRIPKTSSRAITSPAGTADTMEVMAPVALDLAAMRRVVEAEGGCIAWGGSVRLSPADDVLIRIERPLDFDSDGQLVASILSKKLAAGSTHVLIDLPVGPTAKVRNDAAALSLKARLLATAEALGLGIRVLQTDGTQPVGHGIGPTLEARDVLAVLRGAPDAPADLRERSLLLAGAVLDLAPGAVRGSGHAHAEELLRSGAAWRKFLAICEAQGGFTEPVAAAHHRPVVASRDGRIAAIDNRRLAKIAKLAGAPGSAVAGVDCRRRVGERVRQGERLFDVHARTPGELGYAMDYALAHPDVFRLEDAP